MFCAKMLMNARKKYLSNYTFYVLNVFSSNYFFSVNVVKEQKRLYHRKTIPLIRISPLHWLKVHPLCRDLLRSLNQEKSYLIQLQRHLVYFIIWHLFLYYKISFEWVKYIYIICFFIFMNNK